MYGLAVQTMYEVADYWLYLLGNLQDISRLCLAGSLWLKMCGLYGPLVGLYELGLTHYQAHHVLVIRTMIPGLYTVRLTIQIISSIRLMI